MIETIEIPPGYLMLNDGPGRQVLVREGWDECPVFSTRQEASDWAWAQHNDSADD